MSLVSLIPHVEVSLTCHLRQDQINLLLDAKVLVLLLEILAILGRLVLLTLDNTTQLLLIFFLSVNAVLRLNSRFEILQFRKITALDLLLRLGHLVAENEVVDLVVVGLNLLLLYLVLGMQALVDDRLELRTDL